MPTIEITEEQAATLETLQDELTTDYLGEYGTIRPCDAVQYLLDRYTADDEALVVTVLEDRLRECSYQDLQHLASRTTGVEATGKEADLRHRLARARTTTFLDVSTWEDSTPASETSDDASGGSPSDATSASDTSSEASTQSNSESSSSEAGSGGGSSRLERMMGLLDQYADRWEEASTEEGKYVVTLPDGSTEAARTKEDVRALLFNHYE